MNKDLSRSRRMRIGVVLTLAAVLLYSPLAGAAAPNDTAALRWAAIPQAITWFFSFLEVLSSSQVDEGTPEEESSLPVNSADEPIDQTPATDPTDDPEIGPYVDPWG
jgi:hypothetical protein